ncbi:MAG: flippase activity-associated protein Agl23 [bacterium]
MSLKQNPNEQQPTSSLSLSQILSYRIFNLVSVEVFIYLLLLIVAIVTRFWDLGGKALHHDESLHAVYSNYLYEGIRNFLDKVAAMFSFKLGPVEVIRSYFQSQPGVDGLKYHFDPMMHGPSLYHFQAFVFLICGLFVYLWQLPTILILAYFAFVFGSKGFLARKTNYKTRNRKIASWIGVVLLDFILLFVLVYAFTSYSQDKLAGVTDYTCRIAPAIQAVILVLLPYFFRNYLGKLGALITAVLLLISPTALYVGRFQRHDIYLMIPALIMIIAIFRFIQLKDKRSFYIFALATGFIYCTLEVYYIFGFILFLFLLGCFLYEFISARDKKNKNAPSLWNQPIASALKKFKENPKWLLIGFALFLMPVVFFYSTMFSNPMGFLRQALPNPVDSTTGLGYWLSQQDVARGSQNWKYYLSLMFPYELFTVIFGILAIAMIGFKMGTNRIKQAYIFAFTSITTVIIFELADFSAVRRYLQQQQAGTLTNETLLTLRQETLFGLALSFIILVALFFIPYYIGYRKSLSQKNIPPLPQFGNAPFPFFYELFIINWLYMMFMSLSWAGEKMPWLNLHVAVPMAFLAALFLREAVGKLFAVIRQAPIAVLITLSGCFYVMYLLMHPEQVSSPTLWFAPLAIIVSAIAYLAMQTKASPQAKVALIALLLSVGSLSTYSLVGAFRVSYINPDDPKELLVYTQSSKEVIETADKIKKIAASLPNKNDIHINIESTQTWPFVWYLNGYTNIGYPPSITTEPTEEVVLVAKENEEKTKPFLKNYVGQQYVLRWWWLPDMEKWKETIKRTNPKTNQPEEVKEMTIASYIKFWFSPEVWNWMLTREVWHSRKGMSYDGVFYVRKDKAKEIWQDGVPPGETIQEDTIKAEPTPDAYTDKQLKVKELTTWGSLGSDSAKFSEVEAVALDSKQNIYVVDGKNYRVQKFDSTGKFITAFGKEGSGNGEFKNPAQEGAAPAAGPSGIAIDAKDNIYVTDTWNHRIQKFSSQGEFISTFGKPGVSDTEPEFWGPRGIIIIGNEIFVTDTGNKKVKKFDLEGKPLKVWGGSGSSDSLFNEPIGITADNKYVYVADTWNHRIQKFDHEGTFIAQWPVAGWQDQHNNNEPGLTLDSTGNILATDPPNHRILQFDPTGKFLGLFGKKGDGSLQFNKPTGLTIDKKNTLYIADTLNNRIVKVQL